MWDYMQCNFTVQVLYTEFKNVTGRKSNELNYKLVKREGRAIGLNVINNKSQVQHINMESCSEMNIVIKNKLLST